MRFHEFALVETTLLSEGKVHIMTYSYGNMAKDVKVFQNPSGSQIAVLLQQIASKRDNDGYIRGLIWKGKTTLVWDGYEATHDEVRSDLLPDAEDHSSDLTTFEASFGTGGDGSVEYVKVGDYCDTPTLAKLRDALAAWS